MSEKAGCGEAVEPPARRGPDGMVKAGYCLNPSVRSETQQVGKGRMKTDVTLTPAEGPPAGGALRGSQDCL
jgi:hypothetical protein